MTNPAAILYQFPKRTAHTAQHIPKDRFYPPPSTRRAKGAYTKIRRLFTREIERITLSNILSPETTNLPATQNVPRIPVITIALKGNPLTKANLQTVLKAIDKKIPNPNIFIIKANGQLSYAATPKRPSDAEKKSWVANGYYLTTPWIGEASPPQLLPQALNLEILYQKLLASFTPLNLQGDEYLETIVALSKRLDTCQREAAALSRKMRDEGNYQQRSSMHHQLTTLHQEIDRLTKTET